MPADSPFQAFDLFPTEALLPTLLDLATNGIVLCTPIYAPAGTLADLALTYLNPAAQRLLRLPAQPSGTFTQLFADGRPNGSWPALHHALQTGEPGHFAVIHALEGTPHHLHVISQRVGGGLLLSFTEAAQPPEGCDPKLGTEAALRDSEARYRTLFESIDQGFCLIEVLFEGAQHPVDYRFLEVNPAFERQTGLQEAVGRTMRELEPLHEQHWFDIYGQVALSGQPVRFEQRAEQLHRWYDVYAFRVGEPERHQVAILFSDISQRRQAEEALRQREQQQAFLLRLSDQLRPLADPAHIQYQAACALGQYLGASRVGYAEDQGDQAHLVVTCNYTQPGVPSIEGRYLYDDYGPALLQAFTAGRTVVRPDIAHDPTLTDQEKGAYAALQLGATVDVPLRKDGQLIAVFFIHYVHPHAWTDHELNLLEETAERTWAAVVRARTEAALRESEERFRVMADAVPQIVWITDGEGRTEFFNRQWSRYTGVPYELSSAAAVATAFVHPADAAHTMEAFQEARRTGTVFEVEHRIRAADGSYRWFLVRAEPFRNPLSGQITRWFGSSVDIHDRKQVEEALRRSQERLQKALSIDTVGILFFDMQGCIHDSNPAFERMSGYAHARLASSQVYLDTLTTPEFSAVTRQSLQELRSTGESTPLEKQYRRPDGTHWWGLSAGKRLSETECVKFVLDITEAKRAEAALRHSEQELQRFNKQLTRTNQDLDNFVYAASHDLKQPVNNLSGLFEELYRSIRFLDPEEEQVLVPLIQQALQQLGSTIDDLAALGQAQQAGQAPAETVALVELTEEVLTLLEPQMRAARARITTDFAAYPTVTFPRVNLRTVLLNLVSNSLKYADPQRPARIHISVWVDDGLPVLVVEDNGLGFDANKYGEELFHLFRRLHQHTAGSGVGLYLVNRIVQANGGRIEVDSQEGAGATFRVWLGRLQPGQ